MTAYYNEIDPYAAAWLRNLIAAGHIAPGDVDERSIEDVTPDDLRPYTQCHFFAGIGGWAYAARLAGWPDDRPIWTGSCPCQPFSSAARGRNIGFYDARHLWPHWYSLIRERRPPVVFGEQVDEAGAWLDEVVADLEAAQYGIWARILPAYCAGFDHVRQRIFFIGDTDCESQPGRSEHGQVAGVSRTGREPRRMGPKNGVSPAVAQLRAYGNAVVPQVAATVIEAYLDAARDRHLRLTAMSEMTTDVGCNEGIFA